MHSRIREYPHLQRLGVVALVSAYLGAIVAANLTVATFGAVAVIPSSFLLISFDLSSRDALHDAWRGRALWPRMACLIAVGSILSYLLNARAAPIALASFGAFAAAGACDALVYHLLRHHPRLARMNGSNVVGGLVDSVVFLSLLAAFGGLPWGAVPILALGQWAAKSAGGVLWSVVLVRTREVEVAGVR